VRGAVEHHYRSKERPRVSDEAWAEAPPIAKQVADASSLQTIDANARRRRRGRWRGGVAELEVLVDRARCGPSQKNGSPVCTSLPSVVHLAA
jgi:hypothetical protein